MPNTTECLIEGCEKAQIARGWCRMHYVRWQRHGTPQEAIPERPRSQLPAKRLWRHVARKQPGQCWPWTGTVRKDNGYAHIRVQGQWVYAHRLAYEVLVGPIPEGMTVDHTCHNADETCKGGSECKHRICCNPDHLEAVPQLVNWRRSRNNPHNKSA